MKDEKYEATLPIMVGPKIEDWSQDQKLPTVASLSFLKGQLISVKSVGIIKITSEISKGSGIWDEMKNSKFLPIQYRHFELLSDRARILFEDAVLNPDGYSNRDSGVLQAVIHRDEINEYAKGTGNGDFYRMFCKAPGFRRGDVRNGFAYIIQLVAV